MTDQAAKPLPIIRGEHVYLRPAERADVPNFVRWLNDAETTSFLSMRAPMSEAMEEKWFEGMVAKQGTDHYHYVICLLKNDQPIGTLSLFAVDTINGSAGLGISIGEKSLWGKGYGTDAMNAAVDFGFGMLRLERLWLEVYVYNKRARRSYDKSGFVLEGVERHGIFKQGRYVDVELMSILRDEWAALPRQKSWELGSWDLNE